jgi:hypothetical protein
MLAASTQPQFTAQAFDGRVPQAHRLNRPDLVFDNSVFAVQHIDELGSRIACSSAPVIMQPEVKSTVRSDSKCAISSWRAPGPVDAHQEPGLQARGDLADRRAVIGEGAVG